MPEIYCCAECGTPLPVYWPKGLCTSCALDGALDLAQVPHPADAPSIPADSRVQHESEQSSALGSFGDYDLLEEIARGGMGVVYKARQRKLERIVALKMILAGSLAGKEFVQRFRTEAAAAAILRHPNIVAIHDVGVHEGRHYFSMDYVDGQSLALRVGSHPLSSDKAARYVELIAKAIGYAHERGILHRDLKPSNVLIDSDDQPRITDFGLAKRLDGESSLTLSGHVLGSPNFMPPEQAGGERGKVGRASDVYALGGILYYLLTARPPFQAESLEQTIAQVLNVEPVSPRLLNPSIQRDLETITLKCLEKEPSRRYQTAQELADELGRVLRHEPIRARPISPPQKLWRWCHRNPGFAGAIGIAAVAVLAGFATTTWQWRQAENQRLAILHYLYVAKMNLVQTAWDANNVGRVRQLLEETAATPERGFEWYYWQRQTHLQLETLRGHGEPVLAVAYSPDGQRIVTGSADHTAKVWDTATGKELLTLRGHSDAIRSVAFSTDSQYIVTGSFDQTAKVWESKAGKELQTLHGHGSSILSVAFSADGHRVVTGSRDQTATVWDPSTGMKLLTLDGHDGPVWSVAFSPDSERIVTASWDGTAKVWAAGTGTNLLTFKLHNGPVLSAAFSPDGGRIVSGGFDQTARIWEAATGKELGILKGHGGPVVSVAFSSNGLNIATAGEDQTARVWDAKSDVEVVAPKKHGSPISSVAFSPDGQRIITGGGSLVYSPDGIRQIHPGSGDRTAKVWEILKDKGLITLNGHTDQVMAVAFSPDNRRVVTGSLDHTAKLWDATTGEQLGVLKGHGDGIRSVAFSPDGQRIATASWDKTAIVWDATSGQPLLTIDSHKALLMAVAFSPDGGRIVTAGQDGAAKVWDAVSGAELLTLKENDAQIWSVAFSPDGRRILTANGGAKVHDATIWDAANGRKLLGIKGHRSWVMSAAFSPDGHRIITGSHDGTARVWDAATGDWLFNLERHSAPVLSVSFSPDGQRILTASQDQTAKLWDAASGKELLTLKGHSGWIISAAFSPNGKRIVTSGDGTANVWEVASPEQVEGWQEEERTAAAVEPAPGDSR